LFGSIIAALYQSAPSANSIASYTGEEDVEVDLVFRFGSRSAGATSAATIGVRQQGHG
jgi:hypothetical protein